MMTRMIKTETLLIRLSNGLLTSVYILIHSCVLFLFKIVENLTNGSLEKY